MKLVKNNIQRFSSLVDGGKYCEREMEKYFICSWLTGGAYHNMGKCLFCWKNDSARENYDENYRLNLNTETGWNLANDFVEQIVDWNTDGEELAIMTEDDYELYAYKTEDIY